MVALSTHVRVGRGSVIDAVVVVVQVVESLTQVARLVVVGVQVVEALVLTVILVSSK